MPKTIKPYVLTVLIAAASLLAACNQEQQPTYDENAQRIDPALQLYANNADEQGPAPTAEPVAPAPNTANQENTASDENDENDVAATAENPPMPENPQASDPASPPPPAVATSTEPEAMLTADKVELTDDQWKSILSDQEYYILRQSGTERAFTGRLLNEEDPGSYHCAGCGLYLYDAKHKFHSGCGWPSFNQEVADTALTYIVDKSHGMVRTEMRCARCDGHLGHVFDDAPDQPTGLRHCVNGGALIFVPEGADIAQTIREHRAQYADR